MTSLQALVKEHVAQQQKLKDQNERRKKKAAESLQKLSHQLVLQTNRDTVEIFRNQQILEQQTKQMLNQVQRFNQQSQRWIQLFGQLNSTLKEMGDVENWAQVIQQDVQQVVQNIDRNLKEKSKTQL